MLSIWSGKKILSCGNGLTLYQLLLTLKKKPFEYIVEKEENAGNQHFLLFPQCLFFFFSFPEQILPFGLPLSSANALHLDRSKILLFGKHSQTIFSLKQITI